MARKETLVYQLVSAQSLAASFQSPATMIKMYDNCSYQINITTTNSIGTFSVQVSNDYQTQKEDDRSNAGNWEDLTLSGTPSAGAANDNIVIDLNQLPYKAIRLAYTSTVAGTGVADIYVACKSVGA